ncbi:hypothetical protein AVEN_52752-1 [Araneus ventricosus]|uniref:Uncharacterized protein n=1 Tax=Araneus ventricosus TaxID=182803 RepID=A0A4Y2CZE6_ARAVE|nr:hypothetical protein AVEN_52752-1 [Araneus ventricosus]
MNIYLRKIFKYLTNHYEGKRFLESRLWEQKTAYLKPHSIEDPPCMWAWCALNLPSWVKYSHIDMAWKFGEWGVGPTIISSSVRTIQNYKVRSKIAHWNVQNGMSI